MGLPVRQRRVLDHIECTLRGTDPKLAALYATFARLNRDEEMPGIEQLRHGMILVLARLRHVAAILLFPITWLFCRLEPRQRAALLFPVAIAVVVTSIVFAARSGSSDGCVPVRSVSASKSVPKSAKLCRPGPAYTGYYGRLAAIDRLVTSGAFRA
jgi:hypothetical protein